MLKILYFIDIKRGHTGFGKEAIMVQEIKMKIW